ncbi:MAG: hypothetical protein LQ340_005456 [Diploschistes diacapsis]|nr:MAG: hypothetical protein LQ340_005456 [Diploschistes diacapsis]
MLKLMNGHCSFCCRFKLPRTEVNKYICKLRLIGVGLINEAKELDDITMVSAQFAPKPDADDSNEDVEERRDDLVRFRNNFVRHAIRKVRKRGANANPFPNKVQGVAEQRRAVIKEFLSAITKAPKTQPCSTCGGVSPAYRKEGFSKIFRKPLSDSAKAKNAKLGKKHVNRVVEMARAKKKAREERLQDRAVDEGIVLSTDSPTDVEEDSEILQIDHLVVDGTSTTQRSANKSSISDHEQYLNPEEVYAILSVFFEKEQEMLSLIYNPSPIFSGRKILTPDRFFLQNLLVPPNKYRPEARIANGITEAQQNSLYKRIIAQCDLMVSISREMEGEGKQRARTRDFNDFQKAWIDLQDAVNSLIDSDRNSLSSRSNLQIEEGIKQKLEKKEGLFRKNMMGKRVNFAARSVISPDPNIDTNEIGVPIQIARRLTYPESVTNHNIYDLREAVLNGPNEWPGASAIENEYGQVLHLKFKSFDERQALANQLLAPSGTNVKGARNKKVYRYLNNGDIVIMNRQPTLHKPSMMCHRARILPGEKTIRMHYANCNTYNADFDGDEMNLHFPQNENARAEAMLFADTDNQYLVATAGNPLRGLIQDHISMGVWLTNRDTFFTRSEYHQLLYSSMRPEKGHTFTERIETVTPAILKPVPLWSGKQVVTTVLKNITSSEYSGLTVTGKSSTPGDRWGKNSEEADVVFQSGELLCGILDKRQLGPTAGGFVHSVYEAYGHTTAGKLLSILGRLLTRLLHMRALSCGMEDIVLTEVGDTARKEAMKNAEKIGFEVASKYVSLGDIENDDHELRSRLEEVLRDDHKLVGLDSVYKRRNQEFYSELPKTFLPGGLFKPYPRNQMQLMTTSGAKGSLVQATHISANLGQQVLEGRRVPVMVSGKSLPSFKPFETHIRAGGYITDRYLTGVRPQAYFFHAMAGREGLIDTAVKTSSSGYLQRCLVKGMEGLKVEYDTSVRDSDGSMIQFLYGEDGLDVAKQKALKEFGFLAANFDAIIAQVNIQEVYEKIFSTTAVEWQKKALKTLRKTGCIDAIDPALSQFNPGSVWGSTSESFAKALKQYEDENPQRLLRDKRTAPDAALAKKAFRALLDVKYMKSVVDPGEAVGIIAAQSTGEPSTQMTLNTFHLAGHSAKNVTLGIPRLREILMSASTNIMTPTMTLYLNPETTPEDGKTFAQGITKLTLAEVLEGVVVRERVGAGKLYERARTYDIRLNLFPSTDYTVAYAIQVADVARAIEVEFISALTRAVAKDLKFRGPKTSKADIGKSVGKIDSRKQSRAREEGDEGGETAERAAAKDRDRENMDAEDEDDPDDDATQFKQKNRGAGAIAYDAPDDEEEAIARQARIDSEEPESGHELEDEGYGGSTRNSPAPGDDKDGMDPDRRSDAEKQRDRLMEGSKDLIDFSFDEKNGLWCKLLFEYDVGSPKLLMLNHVESACREAVIQSIPGLGACTYVPEEEKEKKPHYILTEGVNFLAMCDYQHIIDPNSMISNDIASVLHYYGVEAARSTIIAEMNAVFTGHGINVDVRHLNLIADYMTRGGGFSPFNRLAMSSGVSPFAKMSFETTMAFVKDAVAHSDMDDLKNPSARLVVGRLPQSGTGSFEVLVPVE